MAIPMPVVTATRAVPRPMAPATPAQLGSLCVIGAPWRPRPRRPVDDPAHLCRLHGARRPRRGSGDRWAPRSMKVGASSIARWTLDIYTVHVAMDEAQRTAPGSEAEQLLADVVQSPVLSVVEVTRPRETPDLVVPFRDGDTVALEVKEAAHPSPDQIGKLVGRSHPGKQSLPVLVADVISEPGRRMLADAGWGFFDRRG